MSVSVHLSARVTQGPEMTSVIRSYNRLAVVLVEYEALYVRGWSQAAESSRHRLNASLLVRADASKVHTGHVN